MTSSEKTCLEQLLINQLTEFDQRFQRHVTTIRESFDLKIGLIAEGQETLRREMSDFKEKVHQDISLLDFKIETLTNI